jgi:hypothetical protein
MPYVRGYKGQKIWVEKKTCYWCDNYDRKLSLCTLKMKKRPKNHTCPYYVPIGQGGGE